MTTLSRTDIEGGKYTVVHDGGINLHVLRHGEPWITESEIVGGKMLLAAAGELDRLRAEIEQLKSDLQFVERWANHHGQKAHMTAEQTLGVIQHYPPIKAITKSYEDGKVPTTFDPYAELAKVQEAAKPIAIKWAQHFDGYPEDSNEKPAFMEDWHLFNSLESAERDVKIHNDKYAKQSDATPGHKPYSVREVMIYAAGHGPVAAVEKGAEHPMQPIALDTHGLPRFKENKIVSFLSEGKLNDIACMDFKAEDRMQLAQLIGYSVEGYNTLSYVSDESYIMAEECAAALYTKE